MPEVFELQRVRLVVWKASVKLEVERDYFDGKSFKYDGHHLAGHTVTGIHHYAHGPYLADEGVDVLSILPHYVLLGYPAWAFGSRERRAHRHVPYLCQTRLKSYRHGVLPAHLEPIVLCRVVGGRDRYAAVVAIFCYGKIRDIRGDDADIRYVYTGRGDAFYKRLGKRGGGIPHVPAHHNVLYRPLLLFEKVDNRRADAPRRILVNLFGIKPPYIITLKYVGSYETLAL